MTEQLSRGDADLLALIDARVRGHERSQQVRIGPSEIGVTCSRKLAMKLAQVPDAAGGPDRTPWRPTVGTAVHAWLAEMLEADNAATGLSEPRWLVEQRVVVGTLDGEAIPGTVDVFDVELGRVVDWKIVGPTSLRDYRRNGPGRQYRVQVHLYGRGLARLGHDVREVAIAFLPSNGELSDAVWWSEPYNPEIGKRAFERIRALKADFDDIGPDLFAELPTRNDHCEHCPFFVPGTKDLTVSCPGDAGMLANPGDQFSDLLPQPKGR